MRGFDKARAVEAQAMTLLLRFLEERSDQYVLTNKGPMAKHLQEVYGDIVFSSEDSRCWTVEVKAEQEWTSNFFLETWSNRNLDDAHSHAQRGSNRGWLEKLRSDLLWYYFIEVDRLYIFNLLRVKRWAFGYTDKDGQAHPAHIYDYREKRQGKYSQMNDTHGRIVPVDLLVSECRGRLVHPRQIELFGEAA